MYCYRLRMDGFTVVYCLHPACTLRKPIKNKKCMPYDALLWPRTYSRCPIGISVSVCVFPSVCPSENFCSSCSTWLLQLQSSNCMCTFSMKGRCAVAHFFGPVTLDLEAVTLNLEIMFHLLHPGYWSCSLQIACPHFP